MTRIHCVEDHDVMCEMLEEFIGLEPDMEVVGVSSTAESAWDEIGATTPDVVLLDIALPTMSGITLAQRLRERQPNLILIMLSGHGERGYVEKALEAGANGYILKGNALEIPTAIREVVSGGRYLSSSLSRLSSSK